MIKPWHMGKMVGLAALGCIVYLGVSACGSLLGQPQAPPQTTVISNIPSDSGQMVLIVVLIVALGLVVAYAVKQRERARFAELDAGRRSSVYGRQDVLQLNGRTFVATDQLPTAPMIEGSRRHQ